MLYRPPSSFTYHKAMAQQERGGVTWRVVTDVVKRPGHRAEKKVYEANLPSKFRAKRLAWVLNIAGG